MLNEYMFFVRAKGIQYRHEQNEAVAGFFSHVGDLYQCHHIWGQ